MILLNVVFFAVQVCHWQLFKALARPRDVLPACIYSTNLQVLNDYTQFALSSNACFVLSQSVIS